MNNNNTTLTTALQIVVGLFGAFGAFLGDILPDIIINRKFIYGITQFSCLLIFLLLKLTLNKSQLLKDKKYWKLFTISMSILFFVFSFLYYNQQKNHLRDSPFNDQKIITGELTKSSLTMCESKQFQEEYIRMNIPCEEAIMKLRNEEDINQIWTPDSVKHNTDLFVFYYVLLVIFLSTAVFAAIELIPKNQSANENP